MWTFFSEQSISLVSKAFNLIPEAFFRKMVEVFIFIFISGLWMLSITNVFTVTIASKRKISVLELILHSIGRLFRPVWNVLKLSESNRNSRSPIRILLLRFPQSSGVPKWYLSHSWLQCILNCYFDWKEFWTESSFASLLLLPGCLLILLPSFCPFHQL